MFIIHMIAGQVVALQCNPYKQDVSLTEFRTGFGSTEIVSFFRTLIGLNLRVNKTAVSEPN